MILTLLALLAGVFGYAVAYMQGWVDWPGDEPGEAVVTTEEPEPLRPNDVSMNVYNATTRPGLAGRAAEALRSQSFRVESVADDPEGASIEGPGVIRHGAAGLEQAQLLAESLPQDLELLNDARDAATIDLVLGDSWEELEDDEGDEGGDEETDDEEGES